MYDVSKEELLKLVKLNSCPGFFADCFLRNNMVLKVYKYKIDYIFEIIGKLMNFKKDNIAFPKKEVIVEGFSYAYVMDYIDGIKFSNLSDYILLNKKIITFENIILCYHDALLKAEFFTDNLIEIRDLNLGNIKLLNNSVGIYDLDFYSVHDVFENKKNEIYDLNLSAINIVFKKLISKLISLIHADEKTITNYIDSVLNSFDKSSITYVDDVFERINEITNYKDFNSLILTK